MSHLHAPGGASIDVEIELERRLLGLRRTNLRRDRRRAIANGRSIGPAPATWGWAKDPDDRGRLHVVPKLAPAIRAAVACREEGGTLRQVAALLEERTGRPWSPTQASRLLDRAARYGVAVPLDA